MAFDFEGARKSASFSMPKLKHSRPRLLGHRGDVVVVGVEDGDAVLRQAFDGLALGLRDRLHRAEALQVGRADVEDDGDLRRGNLAEAADLAQLNMPTSTTARSWSRRA